MNKELIELQRDCDATCVVIPDAYVGALGQTLVMDAAIGDHHLFAHPLGEPIFKEKLERLSQNDFLTYFVIRGIDELTEADQNRYLGLVKDRFFGGYQLPRNVILVFTVKDRAALTKLSADLYHFCVVAF